MQAVNSTYNASWAPWGTWEAIASYTFYVRIRSVVYGTVLYKVLYNGPYGTAFHRKCHRDSCRVSGNTGLGVSFSAAALGMFSWMPVFSCLAFC